jgi:hypothetical protein
MKIVVIGATGQAGTEIVTEAARRGHEVVAVSRHEPPDPLPAGATWRAGDAADAAGIATIGAAADAVVSAFGPSREAGGDPSAFAGQLLGVARAIGSTRLLILGGAGSMFAGPGVRLFDTPGFPDEFQAEARAHAESLYALQAGKVPVDWSYLSPAPLLGPGERTGTYRVGGDSPVGDSISFADCAVAIVDELETPAHRRTRWTVATA